ncbi:MAG: hypothetical protein AAFP67_00605 [Pseudomonadota bacterium]
MRPLARRNRRLARRLTLAIAIAAVGGPATAQEVEISGTLSQRFSYDSDLGLDGGGGAFTTNSSLGMRAEFETEESSGSLSSAVSYRAVIDDGDDGDDNGDLDGFRPNLNGRARFNLGRVLLTEAISFRLDNVAFTDFNVDGDVNPDGIFTDSDARRLDFSFTQGVGYALTQRNTLNFSAGVSITRFSDGDDELEDSDRFFGSIGLSRRVSPRLGLSISAGATRFSSGSTDDETTGTSVGLNFGFNRALQEDVSLSGSVGLRYVRVQEEVSIFPFGTIESDETNLGATGGFSFRYDVGETDLFAGLTQSVAPTEDGDVEESTTLSARVSHRINSRQSFGVNMSFTRRTNVTDTVGASTESDQEFFGQISPSFNYRLTENWNANLGYAFRVSQDDDGSDVSNSVFLSFSRPLRIFP